MKENTRVAKRSVMYQEVEWQDVLFSVFEVGVESSRVRFQVALGLKRP